MLVCTCTHSIPLYVGSITDPEGDQLLPIPVSSYMMGSKGGEPRSETRQGTMLVREKWPHQLRTCTPSILASPNSTPTRSGVLEQTWLTLPLFPGSSSSSTTFSSCTRTYTRTRSSFVPVLAVPWLSSADMLQSKDNNTLVILEVSSCTAPFTSLYPHPPIR